MARWAPHPAARCVKPVCCQHDRNILICPYVMLIKRYSRQSLLIFRTTLGDQVMNIIQLTRGVILVLAHLTTKTSLLASHVYILYCCFFKHDHMYSTVCFDMIIRIHMSPHINTWTCYGNANSRYRSWTPQCTWHATSLGSIASHNNKVAKKWHVTKVQIAAPVTANSALQSPQESCT